jgi:myo-inositol-1(or 4)-monophosphatase
MPSAADDLKLIADAAREAGKIALKYYKRDPEVWWKEGDSPVSAADFAVDQFLRETLMAARPDYGWLSEETADDPARLEAQRTFVVDPIDGTRAFINGRDIWCVSVAVVENGRSVAGVLDCPALNEIYTATISGGAVCNGKTISVRKPGGKTEIAGSKPMLAKLPGKLRETIKVPQHIPSLAYRIALVANGRMDATFVKPYSHDWDLAAADLILSEAGGFILDADAQRPHFAGTDPRKGSLAAGSGDLLRIMTAALG